MLERRGNIVKTEGAKGAIHIYVCRALLVAHEAMRTSVLCKYDVNYLGTMGCRVRTTSRARDRACLPCCAAR